MGQGKIAPRPGGELSPPEGAGATGWLTHTRDPRGPPDTREVRKEAVNLALHEFFERRDYLPEAP